MLDNRNRLRWVSVLGIVFVIFHVVVLFLPFNRNILFWVAYASDALAIVAQYPILKLGFKNGQDVKSRFYGYPIIRIGFIYLFVQCIAGTLVMLLSKWLPFWFVVVTFILILGFTGIGLIGADTVRDKIEQLDTQMEENTAFMHSLYTSVKQLSNYDADINLKDQLSKLAEAIRYSDPVSSASLTIVEERLEKCIHVLSQALSNGDESQAKKLCMSAFSILEERNLLCKQLKGM